VSARAVAPASGSAPAWGWARLAPALLFLATLLISAVTLRRTLDPFDEGLLLQAASRIAGGQWPYADFGWAYGPGQPLLNALAFELTEPTVLAWRIGRALADAGIAVLVWWLVREQGAGDRWALAGGAAAALTMAQPTTANPFPVALLCALAALACAARGRAVPAGLLVAAAAFWRPDFGAAAAVAAVAALALRGAGRRGVLRALAVAAGATALLLAPFAVAAGPGELLDALVLDSTRDGAAWRLPFPFLYDGPLRAGHLLEDGKDLLGHQLPLIGVIGLALAAVTLGGLSPQRHHDRGGTDVTLGGLSPQRHSVPVGLLVIGLGGLAYLLGRADDLHQQPLLVAVCALAAGLIPRARRPLAIGLAAVLGLIALAGAANLASSVLRPPAGARLHLPGVPGILVAPEEARALPALVRDVQRRVPPGEPIYVAPRRSDVVTLTDPLIHFLVRRPNVLRDDAQVLNDPAVQRAVVAALEEQPPRVVVRWADPRSARPEPNDRGRPSGATALDDLLARRYRLAARHGAYDVLVRRG
jgi:hypothetical protein